jgi:5-methylcytosine-specific restriction endonuclease McrA
MLEHSGAWSNLIRRFGMDIVAYKRCSKCGIIKSLDDFPNEKRAKDGKRAECKLCKSKWTKEYRSRRVNEYRKTKHAYYIAHKEHVVEKSIEWALKNPEKRKISQQLYRARDAKKVKDNRNASSRRWRERHPEYKRGWVKSNPDKGQEYHENRRARLDGNGGRFTASQWKSLKDKYGNMCLCCKRKDVRLEADHVVPIKLGGINVISNIQPLCRSCNSKKGTKIIDYRPFVG